ncbi:winged helix-turn-helix transcriptional regulator [Mammaliicoccus vitulinus]|uniref:winged helix-turn-helix transcriptional regulator n=1 Tax=Mammaliicoccus vitulinus TaxID=71237 RepID=UPI0023AB1C27|nr:winged helix-turn-helix transcriptional regulator [Mammaliicoccus vitulinus]
MFIIFYKTIVLRLSELQNKLPNINQRMLIIQLRELEQDKILKRPVYPVVSIFNTN